MSTIIMTACWPLQGMNASQKAVLISLADNANDEGVCWPSIDYIATRTCLSVRAVQNAIKYLQKVGLLVVSDRNGRSNIYTIKTDGYTGDPRKSCTPAESAPPQKTSKPPQNLHPTPAESAEAPANAAPITINNHHRTVIEPSNTGARSNRAVLDVELPTWLPDDIWSDWVEHRKNVKAPLTQKAAELCLRKLDRLRAAGSCPIAVIEQSIITGKWTDLYEVKGSGQSSQGSKGKFNPNDYFEQRRQQNGVVGGDDVIDV